MVDGYLCRLWYRGQPLVCNLCAVQGHKSANCPNKDKCRKCGKSGHFARNCTSDGSAGDSADFPPLASSSQSAEASVSRDSSDSQLLKDNELDLLQSQSILQDLAPVSGDSSEEPNQRAPKRAGKDMGSSAKRSNSAAGPTPNICFTNSQEFASLIADSELDGNNESNEQLNVNNENISANSTERPNEVINNSSANSNVNEVINNNSTVKEVINNSTERSHEVINNSSANVNEISYYSSTERSNQVNDITVNENSGSSISLVENVVETAGVVAATSERPLIEVIDEGQAEVSSDEIESFEDSSPSSSLPPVFSDPPPDLADVMDESDSSPEVTSSPPSLAPPPGQVGSYYEGRSFCAKAKGSRGAASVRQSPLLKPLSGKHILPQAVSSKPKGLRCRASLEELGL